MKMDKFEEIYLELMPIATGLGAGYEMAQDNWIAVTGYSIMTAMFVGENIFRKLKKNSKILEKKLV